MSSDLLSIARSGTLAARTALDVTAQNIANAATSGYVRRSVRMAEVTATGSPGRPADLSLSGVRVDAIIRNADLFRQAEVRRTGSDAARAAAEITGLENVESALENSQLYPAIVGFEAALQQLATDPVDTSLRTAALEAAKTMARGFTTASTALDGAGESLRFEAADGVAQVNQIGAELARVNLRLSRAAGAGSDPNALLDQRDTLLERLSGLTDISASFASDNTVTVRIGPASGPALVQGGTAAAMTMTAAADGTISFALGPDAAPLGGGSLAGKSLALSGLADARTRLDALAAGMASAANAAQASSTALDGTPGQPLFAGTDARSLTVVLAGPAGLATAPAGAPAGSRDPGGLTALRGAMDSAGTATGVNDLLFSVSSVIAGRKVTAGALTTIAASARLALDSQSGVDLDAEAVNLIRFQQAFQASGRAMQVASTLFDTLLSIR